LSAVKSPRARRIVGWVLIIFGRFWFLNHRYRRGHWGIEVLGMGKALPTAPVIGVIVCDTGIWTFQSTVIISLDSTRVIRGIGKVLFEKPFFFESVLKSVFAVSFFFTELNITVVVSPSCVGTQLIRAIGIGTVSGVFCANPVLSDRTMGFRLSESVTGGVTLELTFSGFIFFVEDLSDIA
jgi:hypothetical protein